MTRVIAPFAAILVAELLGVFLGLSAALASAPMPREIVREVSGPERTVTRDVTPASCVDALTQAGTVMTLYDDRSTQLLAAVDASARGDRATANAMLDAASAKVPQLAAAIRSFGDARRACLAAAR